MSYLGDIRENSIGPNGEIWESDNRIEARHYWNGAYIDLCDLPAEDYAKTIFVTNGTTSGDNNVPMPTIKIMTLEIIEGDAIVTYSGALTSDIYIALSYNGGQTFSKLLTSGTVGSSGVSMGLSEIITIDGYGIGATEADAYNEKKTFQDDEYKYQINYKKSMTIPVAYQISLLKGEIDNLSDEELIAKIKKVERLGMKDEKESETFTAKIEPIAIEGFADMEPNAIDEVLLSNAQDIIIVSDREIVDILAASTNDSVKDSWSLRNSTLTIDGVKYYVWYKRAENTELTAVYDPAVPDAKVEIPEDAITFIIRYA